MCLPFCNWNSHFSKNWNVGFLPTGEESYIFFPSWIFTLFGFYLLLRKRVGPFFSSKMNILYPRMLCTKLWLKLTQWFWRRRFLFVCLFFYNFVNAFSLFFLLSPLWKGRGPSFKQIWIPFTQEYFVPSLV